MTTKDHRDVYNSLPANAKPVLLALSVLIERISAMPKADRDDLFELLQEWRKAPDPEERENILSAMEEILAQVPLRVKKVDLGDDGPLSDNARAWARHVGKKIREMRESAGLTQVQLAASAGIPQSHLSRIETAEYTPTHMTLEKIARALGIDVGQLDPCL